MLNEHETELMSVRWKIFTFSHQIKEHDQQEMEAFSKCFADLFLNP